MATLTVLQIKTAKPGDKLTDGGGLRLDVDKNGNKSWVFRFKSPVSGKERYMGLGPFADVPLADARDAAHEARGLLRNGVDPIEHRKERRAEARVEASKAVTFKAYAEQFIFSRQADWKNDKHRQQWRNSLRDYAYPYIGHLAVSDVDTPGVLKILRPIWTDKKETSRRVRGRIEAILNAAKAEGIRTGENPALWRGHLDQLLARRRKKDVKHHPALPYADLPAFMASLRSDKTDAARLLQFIILTAARYGEAAKADRQEIRDKLWTVPGVRMKGDRDHRVPLSDAALLVLATATSNSELVFPGQESGRPISDVNLANTIKRHTGKPATTHGFRSTFRDWAGDCTSFPREIIEMALAHAIDDETEEAYRRSDALEKRRALMAVWAEFCAVQ